MASDQRGPARKTVETTRTAPAEEGLRKVDWSKPIYTKSGPAKMLTRTSAGAVIVETHVGGILTVDPFGRARGKVTVTNNAVTARAAVSIVRGSTIVVMGTDDTARVGELVGWERGFGVVRFGNGHEERVATIRIMPAERAHRRALATLKAIEADGGLH